MPIDITTSAGQDEGARSITLPYEFGKDCKESISLFGEITVHQQFIRSATVDFQGRVRSLLKANKTNKEIQEEMATWKPSDKAQRGKSKVEKTLELWQQMTPEERRQAMADLKESLKAVEAKAAGK